jgi:hypothetical protein
MDEALEDILKVIFDQVKLPGHRPGLPGKVISFYIVPLPACRQAGTPPIPIGRDGAPSGQMGGARTFEELGEKCLAYSGIRKFQKGGWVC